MGNGPWTHGPTGLTGDTLFMRSDPPGEALFIATQCGELWWFANGQACGNKTWVGPLPILHCAANRFGNLLQGSPNRVFSCAVSYIVCLFNFFFLKNVRNLKNVHVFLNLFQIKKSSYLFFRKYIKCSKFKNVYNFIIVPLFSKNV